MGETARRYLRRGLLLILGAYWLLLFTGTHLPIPPGDDLSVSDKVLHFVAYAGLAFLLAWSLRVCWGVNRPGAAVLLVIGVYGMVDEWTQSLVPHRSTELGDWIADVAGGLAGLGLYAAMHGCGATWLAGRRSLSAGGQPAESRGRPADGRLPGGGKGDPDLAETGLAGRDLA